MKIVQKWGFGMAPPKPSTEKARLEAARGVIAPLGGQPAANLENILAQLSVAKGLFNRVAKEDQWDWFYVKGQLGYPSASAAKQIGFALTNLRNSLKQNDEAALIDIRAGIKRLPITECLSFFIGESKVADEPNAGWLYIFATRETPSFLKIGMTTRSVEARVREINAATGVLIPFGIWRCWRVLDPYKAEKLVHAALIEFRVRSDREFFAIDVSEASRKILNVLQEHGLLLRTLENLAALGGYDVEGRRRALNLAQRNPVATGSILRPF